MVLNQKNVKGMPEGNWGLGNREGNGLARDWAPSSSVVTNSHGWQRST